MKKEETHELPKLDAGSILLRFFKELWNTFKLGLLSLALLAWKYSAEVVRYIDPFGFISLD